MMDEIQKRLLAEVADLHGVPEGAYNIRANGQMAARNTTANIDIVTKEDKPGIDIQDRCQRYRHLYQTGYCKRECTHSGCIEPERHERDGL